MDKLQARRDLTGVLASLYPREADVVRVATDAGLNIEFIEVDPRAINTWSNVVSAAELQGELLKVLVTIALEENPGYERLKRVWAEYQAATEASPPKDRELDLDVLAELLRAAFTAEDLRRLIMFHKVFGEALDNLAPKPGLNDLVYELIVFARKRDELESLAKLVEAERPRQYQRFLARLYQPPAT